MELPNGYSLKVKSGKLTVASQKGELEHFYDETLVKVSVEGNEVKVEPIAKERRTVRSAICTTEAHIRNMIKGLEKPYEKKLTLVYAHFPVTVEVKGSQVLIKNFLGEKTPRVAEIAGKTKVIVAGQDITVQGPDKDAVGQTANNIAKATRITNKDIRVFQDGIYYA